MHGGAVGTGITVQKSAGNGVVVGMGRGWDGYAGTDGNGDRICGVGWGWGWG